MAQITDRMDKSLESLSHEFAKVRTGRANANILSDITIDYYGVATPITQVAAVKVPEAHMLMVEPWDKSVLNAIVHAINASDLGITPSTDGTVVRLPFPAPTEERRRQLVKDAMHLGEEAKVAVRNIRRDAIDKGKAMKKAGELTEDDLKNLETDVQKLTDKYTKEIDKICEAKNKEIMEI